MSINDMDHILSPSPEEWDDSCIIFVPEKSDECRRQSDIRYPRPSNSPSRPHSPLPMTPIVGKKHPRTCTPADSEIWHFEPFLGPIPRSLLWRYLLTYFRIRLTPVSAVTSPESHEKRAVFWGSSEPDMPIENYVSRLISYTHCSPSAFIVALIYLDRMIIKRPLEAALNLLTLHRLMISALTLATAFLDDKTYSINHYARVGGVPSKVEMIRLELVFLEYIDFDLHVTNTPYQKMLFQLQFQQALNDMRVSGNILTGHEDEIGDEGITSSENSDEEMEEVNDVNDL